MHASGGLAGDFDGVLQDALGDDVALRARRRLRADEHAEIPVAALAELLQLLLQTAQPLGHQVDVLAGTKGQGLVSPLITPCSGFSLPISVSKSWHQLM